MLIVILNAVLDTVIPFGLWRNFVIELQHNRLSGIDHRYTKTSVTRIILSSMVNVLTVGLWCVISSALVDGRCEHIKEDYNETDYELSMCHCWLNLFYVICWILICACGYRAYHNTKFGELASILFNYEDTILEYAVHTETHRLIVGIITLVVVAFISNVHYYRTLYTDVNNVCKIN